MIRELPDSKGYNAALMVVDCLSKQIHAIPTVTSLDSARVTWLFLEHVWCHHRLPEEVISDCGPTFVFNFSHDLTTLLGVKLTPSTSYHPQTDCQGRSKTGSIHDVWVPVELRHIYKGSLKGNGSLLNA